METMAVLVYAVLGALACTVALLSCLRTDGPDLLPAQMLVCAGGAAGAIGAYFLGWGYVETVMNGVLVVAAFAGLRSVRRGHRGTRQHG